MDQPLATVIRLLAAPKLSIVGPGVIGARVPFLKLIGNHAGEIDLQSGDNEPGPRQWIAVVGLLLPRAARLAYDTAAARVEIFSPPSGSAPAQQAADQEMRQCVRKLVETATRSAAKLMIMSRERREHARSELIRALRTSPIDLRDDDAESRLMDIIDRL